MHSACWKQHTSIYIFPPKNLLDNFYFHEKNTKKNSGWTIIIKYPSMRYISTRGKESGLTFEKVLFSGKKEYIFYIDWVCNLAFYFLLKILLKIYIIFIIIHLGYAQDGGLYFPESIPKLDKIEIEKMANLTYPELVKRIMPLFIDESEIPLKDLHLLIDRAFKKFSSNCNWLTYFID